MADGTHRTSELAPVPEQQRVLRVARRPWERAVNAWTMSTGTAAFVLALVAGDVLVAVAAGLFVAGATSVASPLSWIWRLSLAHLATLGLSVATGSLLPVAIGLPLVTVVSIGGWDPGAVRRLGLVGVAALMIAGTRAGVGWTLLVVALGGLALCIHVAGLVTESVQRRIDRALARRQLRRQVEVDTNDQLQRARLVERRLVEVAANLRSTQEQLEADVTRRQQMADQLRVALLRAEEANRAKSAFLARMSHELRTPLNSVIGFSALLRKGTADRLVARELTFLDRIHANGSHLLGVINDILDLSRIEAGKMHIAMEHVSVAAVMRDAADVVQPQVKPGVEFRVQVPGEEHLVEADPGRLKQILINLLSNAAKFTDRGSVAMSLVLDRFGVPQRIDVTDTGAGIDASRQAAIFDPFEQADNSTARVHGGTGLGLAICRQLCALQGMSLTLRSTLGTGSTFSLHFTAHRPAPGGGELAIAASGADDATMEHEPLTTEAV